MLTLLIIQNMIILKKIHKLQITEAQYLHERCSIKFQGLYICFNNLRSCSHGINMLTYCLSSD